MEIKKDELSQDKIAAIDMGSNAIRLIIGIKQKNKKVKILKKIREPVRIGEDVFTNGEITEVTVKKIILALEKFKNHIRKHKIRQVTSFATSALREAKNRTQVLKQILDKTGLAVELIDGTREGQLVYLAIQKEMNLKKKNCLLIDIGGGSVEVSFTQDEKIIATASFPLGTVRMLTEIKKRSLKESDLDSVLDTLMDPLNSFLNNKKIKLDFAVGTGGNIECLGKLKLELLKKTPNTQIEVSEIKEIIEKLKKWNYEDRIKKLGLRPDRADVILPASLLLTKILSKTGSPKLLIPFVGLREGILWDFLSVKTKVAG